MAGNATIPGGTPNHAPDQVLTLKDMGKTFSKTLDLKFNYSLSWTARDAFRELIQNWRDAIIQASNMPPEQFKTVMKETTEDEHVEILYTVHYDGECLGYIRYSGTDGEGFVDITNRNALLELEHLDFGPAGKQDDTNLAGEHGDGMKVAILVFMRRPQSHIVRFHASGVTWNFNWRKRSNKLGVNLSKMDDKTQKKLIEESEQQVAEGLVPFVVDPCKDVQILLGTKGKANDEYGAPTKRSAVSARSFRKWCEVASWLQPVDDADVVETDFGSLYLGKLRGNIYLKGLLLRASENDGWRLISASQTGKPLKYGYDFRQGKVNRDRQAVNNSNEESEARLNIWDEVVEQQPERVAELHELLMCDDKFADVVGVKKHLDRRTVIQLWDYIRETNKDTWFWHKEQRTKIPRLHHILDSLGYKGQELPNTYWTLFSEHSTGIRTVQQEQQRHFNRSVPVPMPSDDRFAQLVFGTIKACLACCAYTKAIRNVQLVQAGNSLLLIQYDSSAAEVKIHEKCIRKDVCVNEMGLPANISTGHMIVHIVKHLFEEALEHRLEASAYNLSPFHRRRECNIILQKLLNFTAVLDSLALSRVQGFDDRLQLKWAGTANADFQGRLTVQLHRESTCSHLKEHRLNKELSKNNATSCMAPGACSIIFDPSSGSHVFRDLLPEQKYFAILLDAEALDDFNAISETCATGSKVTQRTRAVAPETNSKRPTYRADEQISPPPVNELADLTWYAASRTDGGGSTQQSAWIAVKEETSEKSPEKKTPNAKRRRTEW